MPAVRQSGHTGFSWNGHRQSWNASVSKKGHRRRKCFSVKENIPGEEEALRLVVEWRETELSK